MRYVDDVFCLFTIPKTKILDFHSRINKWHKNLHFTVEFENDNSIAFLDVLVTREIDQLTTSLYRKATHTGLYMLWDSCQNRRYKLGLIRTLVMRIYRICSTEKGIKNEISSLRQKLEKNGYSSHIMKRGVLEAEIVLTLSGRLLEDRWQTNILGRIRSSVIVETLKVWSLVQKKAPRYRTVQYCRQAKSQHVIFSNSLPDPSD